MSTTQVAVRLDDAMLQALDWVVIRCNFENRAEAIRAALAQFARDEREREIDEKIIASYTECPQTDDDLIVPDLSVWDDLDDEDWSAWP